MTDYHQAARRGGSPEAAASGEAAPAAGHAPQPHGEQAGAVAAGSTGADAGAARQGGPDNGAGGVPGGAVPIDGQAADVAGDLSALVKKAGQRDEYLALAQRTQADFENYRKRVARDAAMAQERGVASLARELLPALDSLDRALEAAAKDDPLLEGLKLVRAELSAALARVGVESFRPQGEQFDPSLHEAVATVPCPDPATAGEGATALASGSVVEVYQDGYRLREQVIRPARVVVAA